MHLVLFVSLALAAPEDHFSRAGVRTALSASVRIKTENGTGTGVVVGSRDGYYYVLLASHSIGRQWSVELFSADTRRSRPHTQITDGIELLADLPHHDSALLRFPCDKEIPTLRIRPPYMRSIPESDDPIMTVGCSHSHRPTLLFGSTAGVHSVSHLRRDCIRVSAESAPGRSGGPLLDSRLYLIGTCYGHDGNGHALYVPLPALYATCDAANASWLYVDPAGSPTYERLALAFAKVLIGIVTISLASFGSAVHD